MTTANESKLGGARGGHRGPIVLRVAAARVLPVAARGARLVLSMGLAAGCVRARSSSSPLRGGHCPPLAASTSRLEVWLRCSVHVGCGTPLFRRVVGCRRPARACVMCDPYVPAFAYRRTPEPDAKQGQFDPGGKTQRTQCGRSYPALDLSPVRREGSTGPERPQRRRPDGQECYAESRLAGAKRRRTGKGEETGMPTGRPPGE